MFFIYHHIHRILIPMNKSGIISNMRNSKVIKQERKTSSMLSPIVNWIQCQRTPFYYKVYSFVAILQIF